MKSKLWIAVAVMLSLALSTGFGCAKKKAAAEAPAPAPVQKTEPAPKPATDDKALKEALAKAVAELAENRVYFDFDKFEIKPEFRPVLEKKAELLKKYSQIKVTIEGHCDERGTEEYNLALGERRAKAVAEYLVMLGVSSARIQTISYGEERPACTEHKEGCWSKNRRAEFVGVY